MSDSIFSCSENLMIRSGTHLSVPAGKWPRIQKCEFVLYDMHVTWLTYIFYTFPLSLWLCSHLAALHQSALPLLYSMSNINCEALHTKIQKKRTILGNMYWSFLLNCFLTMRRRAPCSLCSSLCSFVEFFFFFFNNGGFYFLLMQ